MSRWLVTGGSGSFGQAMIRTVLRERPDVEIVSVSRNAEMRYRLETLAPEPRLTVVPGDVRVISDLQALSDLGPFEVVVHAAAEKHIGTGHRYARYVESVNLDGTLNVLAMAEFWGVPRTVFLSTDKACEPQTFYGQVKAQAEAACVARNTQRTRVSVVRYGNVAASSGSVIPLFFKQRESGRLTVTDRRMTRYWMPLSDDADVRIFEEPRRVASMSAVRWVLLALEHMAGAEVFVPQIPSARVEDVARAIAPDAEIVEIGIRGYEKVDEDLVSVMEGRRCWRVPFGGWAILPTEGHDATDLGWTRVPEGFCYRSDQFPLPVRLGETAVLG